MDLIVSLDQAAAQDPSLTGGKGAALAKLAGSGFPVPPGMCVTIPAYRRFLNQAGLKERILREVKRKDPGDTRWEEMWDASLRIRNLFLTASMSPGLEGELTDTLKTAFGATPVAVRSSSAAEDASRTSFAGLHESFLNVSGHESILRHVRLVWASLWSDGALLYQEEVEADAMAVVIQPLISGESSGVAFGVDPTDRSRGVIEAVYGLNKGLVDGDVEPDRWLIGRDDGMIRDHYQPVRDRRATLTAGGVTISPLVGDGKAAPLTEAQVSQVWSAVVKCEQLFGSPQDVEWTFAGNTLTILQSRPITTTADEPAQRGSKAWNLGLKGSLHRLKELRERIDVDLSALDDEALADELMQRTGIFRKWSDIYWDEFIPMAHGVRLFGQVYNDVMGPDDPFEFVKALPPGPLDQHAAQRGPHGTGIGDKEGSRPGQQPRKGGDTGRPSRFYPPTGSFSRGIR
jgi:pyruvate,water dikinase